MAGSRSLMPTSRLTVFLLMSTVAAGAVPAHPATASPNIIVITLDTTRADRMGFLGCKRGLTPNLDALARQGIVFTRAYAHVPLTTASHATIFTGTYPQFNHVNDFAVPLSPRLPYLPEILHGHGYHTAAFVGSLILDPLDGTAPGFGRGFEVYGAGFQMRRRGADRYKTVEHRGGVVMDHALDWLSKRPRGPFFLWVHLYDAHDPYDPPEPFKSQYASAPYDGEIAYADSVVGRLLTWLRANALYDGALIAVMADHGESLGQHGEQTHGIFLYDETIHVPLLFKLPANRPAARRVEDIAELADVAPTLLSAAGIPVPKEMQGQSLLERMKTATPAAKRSAEARSAYAENDYPHRAFGWSSLRALRSGKYLYVRAPERELYNEETDPGEQHNLAAGNQAVANTLASQLDQFRNRTAQTMIELAKPDPKQLEKLQALGYVPSEGKAGTSDDPAGIDPKSKIEVSNLLHDAMLNVEDARYEEALPLLDKVLKQQPEMPVAELQLGIAHSRLRDFDQALAPLQKAVELLPDNGKGHYELGLVLFETGDWKAAAPQFEAAVARAPGWADAHYSLAAVLARINRVPEAMTELDITLALKPDHYRANLIRGRILFLQGNAADALANLQKAAEVEPDSREAHLFLADALARLGRDSEAQQERATAAQVGASPK